MTTNILHIPFVEAIDGKPMTTSNVVAKYFKKRHDNVVRDIRKLIKRLPKLGLLNFEEIIYTDSQGRPHASFRMDRKGFVMLVMGFTGDEALLFKDRFIDAFDSMEQLIAKTQIGTLQDVIQKLKTLESERAKASFAGKALSEWKNKKDFLTIEFESSKSRLQLNLPIE